MNSVFIPDLADCVLVNGACCRNGRIIGQGSFGVLGNVGSRSNSTSILDGSAAFAGCRIHRDRTGSCGYDIVDDAGASLQFNIALCTADGEVAIAVINGGAGIHGDACACCNVGIVLDARTSGSHADGGASVNFTYVVDSTCQVLRNRPCCCFDSGTVGNAGNSILINTSGLDSARIGQGGMCILGKGCTGRDGSIILDIRTGRGHLNGSFTINSSLVPQLVSSFLFNGTFRSCDSFHVGQGRTSSFRYVQTCADNVGVGNSASRTVRGTHAYRAIIANSLNRTVIGDAIIGCGHGHGTSISRNSVVGDAGSGGQGNVAACTANDEAAIAVVNGRASIHGDTRACSNVGIVLDICTRRGHVDGGSSFDSTYVIDFACGILVNGASSGCNSGTVGNG